MHIMLTRRLYQNNCFREECPSSIEIKNVISHVTLRSVLSVWIKLGLEIKH